jgi:hypothetical protein
MKPYVLQSIAERSIRRVYEECLRSSTEEERLEWSEWYERAHLECKNIASQYGKSYVTVAAMVAVLSPANKWHFNLLDCVTLLEAEREGIDPHGVNVHTYNTNKHKAIRIMRDEPHGMSTINGRKVQPFFAALCGADAVVIDRWMLRVCGLNSDVFNLTDRRYDILSDVVRQFALELGFSAHSLQAMLWCYVRGNGQ